MNKNYYHNYLIGSSKNDLKHRKEYRNANIMNKILLNYPEILKNFRKNHSKTPNKIRVKSPSSGNNIESKRYTSRDKNNIKLKKNQSKESIRKKNENNINNKNNLREKYYSPLTRYVKIKNEKIIENKNIIGDKIQKNRILYSNNIPNRSISFSILDSFNAKKSNNINDINTKNNNNSKIKDDNENNINNKENIINQNNDENKIAIENFIDSLFDENNLKPKKICKKIYKIESLCQVGYSGPGIVKYNQDNFFVYKNLNDENNVLFIGVCDGHGLVGHDVSKYLINNLPKNLNKALKKTNKYIHDKETLYKTMKEVFINTNKDLCKSPFIDTQFSGSTCVTIILTKNKIISGNAGDSRAVMGRFENGKWISIDLTHDQKPNNPGERERILSHGGRIEAYKDENGNDFGPKRVWIKNEDIPGLAMSRSFGDEVAASVGTISEPEIESFDITSDDKFIIIASDGIWEFISSQECVNIIKDFYLKKDLKGCLKFLLNESSKRWIKEEEVIDDITAVLIFFED